MEFLHNLVQGLLHLIYDWGYWGIVFLMTLESTVFPIPSELVVAPAGYWVAQGKMNFFMVVLASTAGSLCGASINYLVSMWVGRPFLQKYGKYFFVKPETLEKTERFFVKHGAISTFTGRLLPVIRHLISIPAGLARMNFSHFVFYTVIGSALWSTILAVFGYFIGDNEAAIKQNIMPLTISVIAFVGLLVAGYYFWQKRQANQ